MSEENSANKFIKCVLKFDPKMTFKATTFEGQTFKSKDYDNANKKFKDTMSKKLRAEYELGENK
jgi:hypothetical protein